jgi:hypothetical protein
LAFATVPPPAIYWIYRDFFSPALGTIPPARCLPLTRRADARNRTTFGRRQPLHQPGLTMRVAHAAFASAMPFRAMPRAKASRRRDVAAPNGISLSSRIHPADPRRCAAPRLRTRRPAISDRMPPCPAAAANPLPTAAPVP